MTRKRRPFPGLFCGVILVLWSLVLLVGCQGEGAAELPRSTQELLTKFNLGPSVLADLDQELQLPSEWIEKAKMEGKLLLATSLYVPPDREITGTPLEILLGPFKERYPFISVERIEKGREVPTSYKPGETVADVAIGVGGENSNALEDLRDIPGMKNIPEGAKDSEGLWVGLSARYNCMAYNTRLVKEEDLPRIWEDLLTNPKWRGGNLVLVNRPNLWAHTLWQAKGEEWTKDFLTRLFTEVKPQLRGETMNEARELLAAGKVQAVIPVVAHRIYQRVLAGAQVGFTCPEPVPVIVGDAGILKRAPHPYAAKVFLNWLLSKEGQIALHAAQTSPPLHKGLMLPEVIPFSAVIGKEVAYFDPDLEDEIRPKLTEFWNGFWPGDEDRR